MQLPLCIRVSVVDCVTRGAATSETKFDALVQTVAFGILVSVTFVRNPALCVVYCCSGNMLLLLLQPGEANSRCAGR